MVSRYPGQTCLAIDKLLWYGRLSDYGITCPYISMDHNKINVNTTAYMSVSSEPRIPETVKPDRLQRRDMVTS